MLSFVRSFGFLFYNERNRTFFFYLNHSTDSFRIVIDFGEGHGIFVPVNCYISFKSVWIRNTLRVYNKRNNKLWRMTNRRNQFKVHCSIFFGVTSICTYISLPIFISPIFHSANCPCSPSRLRAFHHEMAHAQPHASWKHFPWLKQLGPLTYIRQTFDVDNSTFHYRCSAGKQVLFPKQWASHRLPEVVNIELIFWNLIVSERKLCAKYKQSVWLAWICMYTSD